MPDDLFHEEGEDEREAAEDRIRRIRDGGAARDAVGGAEPAADLGEPEVVNEVRSRAQATRRALGLDEAEGETPQSRQANQASGGTGRAGQGIIVIGGLVVIGVIIVLMILAISALTGRGSVLAPATETPVPTATVPPTETLLPATQAAPNLALPPLTCIFQSNTGCYDYCQAAENADECQSARDFIEAQNADPDAWFECLAPGPGPNVGNPQACLEEAWRARNP
jgi:hypothetical protein